MLRIQQTIGLGYDFTSKVGDDQMFKPILAGLVLATTVTSAQAFEVKSGAITLGYGEMKFNDGPGVELNNSFIGGQATLGFGDNFDLNFGFNHANSEILFENMAVFSLSADYRFSDVFSLGVFLDHTKLSDMYFSANIRHFGVQGSLYFNNFELMGFVGRGSDGEDESNVYGVDGSYSFASGFDAGFFFIHEDFDYDAIKQYGVHVGYALQGDSAAPVYLNITFGRSEGFFETANHFGASVTVPLGNAAPRGTQHFHAHSADINILSNFGRFGGGRPPRCLCD